VPKSDNGEMIGRNNQDELSADTGPVERFFGAGNVLSPFSQKRPPQIGRPSAFHAGATSQTRPCRGFGGERHGATHLPYVRAQQAPLEEATGQPTNHRINPEHL
jgi:hypothetical protein